MRQLRALFFRLAGLFHKVRRDRELAAEMDSHLQLPIMPGSGHKKSEFVARWALNNTKCCG
jgi:hypothetical protein